MQRLALVVVLFAALSCSPAPHTVSSAGMLSLSLPLEHPHFAHAEPGEPYPDAETITRDPFVVEAEVAPPPTPPPPPPPGAGRDGGVERSEVERCPKSCQVTSIIEGRFSQFVCGETAYGVDDVFEGKWIVGDITAEGAVLRSRRGPMTCTLPFARAAMPPIQSP
jgi:hypothetical protein